MDRNEELRQWFEIADTDLASAEYLAAARHPRPDQIICFHCQQAAEKYLKGFLFEKYVEPPKIHNLRVLLAMCEKIAPSFNTILIQCNFLNRYSAAPHYPKVKDFVAKAREEPCS